MAESSLLKKSRVATKAKARPLRNHPTLYKMVIEALGQNKSAKGLTIQGIKKYVVETYPETKDKFSNVRLGKAMRKGMENTEIVKSKASESDGIEGLKGYFLINRALIAQQDQEKKKSLKSKVSKEGKTVKSPKKATGVKRTSTKSPSKTAKSPKASETTPKPKKSPAAKKLSKSKTGKSPKVKKTPKTSKADSGGAHAKTASVKKLKKTAAKVGTKASKK